MMASAMCKVTGQNIPIYPGCEQPLLVAQQQPYAPQAAALAKWDHDEHFPRGQAVEFLRQTIRDHPGEITLLTIAPLTNIGLLFAVDREIPSLLKRLVMMCGTFTNRLAGVGPREWNAIGDPHATAIVYDAPVTVHRSLGLDVTLTCAAFNVAQVLKGKDGRNLLDHGMLRLRRALTREVGVAPVIVYADGCYAILDIEEVMAATGRRPAESLRRRPQTIARDSPPLS